MLGWHSPAIPALEIDEGISPIDLFLDYTRERAAHRHNKMPMYKLLVRRLGSKWIRGDNPVILPSIPVRPSLLAAHRTGSPLRNEPLSTPFSLACLTAPTHERVDLLALSPWNRSFLGPELVRRWHWIPYRREDMAVLATSWHKSSSTKYM